MDIPESKLYPPKNFPFPFVPYNIQEDLMKNLYEALEGRNLGIFESPTGTGKSMSLICGSLKWLIDAQQRVKDDLEAHIKKLDIHLKTMGSGENWLDEHAKVAKIKLQKDSLQTFKTKITGMENRIETIKMKSERINSKSSSLEKIKLLKNAPDRKVYDETNYVDDHDLLLDDYSCVDKNFDLEDNSSDSESEPDLEKYNGIKIFMCSRTHSQLSQLVREIQRSPYSDMKIRVVSLGSRQNYCINESVLKLKHLPLINEKCQDLHKKNKGKATKCSSNAETLKRQKTSAGCLYYNQSHIENLRIGILNQILDVEQLLHKGSKLNGCPYYASRYAVDDAQIVFMPYSTILHKSTRKACGIDLKDSVVIIDEAHNLLDAIGSIHSCSISGFELAASYSQLVQYRDKYSERFSPLNLLHINQLIFIVNKLLIKVGGKGELHPNTPSEKKIGVTLETLDEFIFSTEIDTISFYKIIEFITKSNIVNKLRGFVDRYVPTVVLHKNNEDEGVEAFLKKITRKTEEVLQKKEKEEKEKTDEKIISGNPIFDVVTFIQSLNTHCADARIVCSINKTIGASSLKFLLLNPASHFTDIVKSARSVILAGGTMQPFSEFTDQLFNLAGGKSDRFKIFSCGHITPQENILPIIVSSGPSGKIFDFSYQKRGNLEMLDELGRLLINVCNVVPAGVVCFFSSYEYEHFVFERFQKTKVLEKLENKKKVLREPKKSNKVDEVLKYYYEAVRKQGALLFSVVGGKLSEGLNFNDDLGRCVIVVGLPYPNLNNPELKEKMNYLNNSVGPTAGKTYYENLCMKAVNQSIGRSVRHKNDYASVLLIDQRFSRPKCAKGLPQWIQKSLHEEEKFGSVVKLLAQFFAAKKKAM